MSEKKGFLTKEGGKYKSWKKRWCVLKQGCLHYSKSQSSSNLGIIPLKEAGKIKQTDELRLKKKKCCFELETPKRTYYMCAENDAEMASWISDLCSERDRVQGKSNNGNNSSNASTSSTTSTSTTTSTTSAGANGNGSNNSNSNSSSNNGSSNNNNNNSSSSNNRSTQDEMFPEDENDRRVGINDFDIMTVIGKGSFGKVFQVRKKDTSKIYAMKVLNKKTILERNELEHTRAEKSILQKLCHPFLVNLNYAFQTEEKLFFIMDFVNGGELFFHLQKDKKFTEERVRFYSAEIVLGLEYLHKNGVLYRDLKPENILLTADGHICMTDFGISKEGLMGENDRTTTFCGTPEYLAPEVLEGNGYGKAVDWWSFGTLMYEMLVGLPPFYSQDVQQMYTKIMTAKLNIPKTVSEEARTLLEGLLERDPERRLTEPSIIKSHPFFRGMDWEALLSKDVTPPFIPPVTSAESVTQIDPSFISEDPTLSLVEGSSITAAAQENFAGFTYVGESSLSSAI
eukprot:TRINITY_DN296_c1_g1_i2.p1 TRINITY_DN296_c1_g1~~TRINITY_DN296_c1_g1_i2.p1  ORF type:complete len:512 (+),score=247.07 TRINITY_DN296_c1_g1_i2:276-1811(+)